MSYDATIIADSPSVFWPMNDTGTSNPTSIADASGNARNGTLTAYAGFTPNQASLLAADLSTKSIAFLSANVTAASIPGPGTGDFAFEIWFKTKNTTSQMVLMDYNAGLINFQINASTPLLAVGSSTVSGTSGIADGLAHHAMGVRRSGMLYLYIDGTSVGTPVASTTDLGSSAQVEVGALGAGGYHFAGSLQKFAAYNGTITAARALAHYNAGTTDGATPSSVTATIAEQNLPSNHRGNITVHAVGTGTSWANGTTGFIPSIVAGWTVASVTVADPTHATIVLTPPAAASPPNGATGTLTLIETGTAGGTTPTISVVTPILAVAPAKGQINGTQPVTLTGSNTLWSSEKAAGLFTVPGASGSGIGTPTVISNGAAIATVTVGTAIGSYNITDASTGATATFAAGSNAVATITDSSIAPCGFFSDGYAIDRAAGFAKSNYAGWDFKFTGTSLSMGLANVGGVVNLNVTVDGITSSPMMPAQGTTAWPAATVIWTGNQGTHTAQIREAYTGYPHFLAIDSANAFIASGTTPSFAPPADTGPTYVINQPLFSKHSAREGAWEYAHAGLIGNVDSPTLYATLRVGQVLRWRGHATKIRLRGYRAGGGVISFLQDGVAGTAFAVPTDSNDPYGWFTLGTPVDVSGDHEYGVVVSSGTIFIHEVQMCGGALNTTATFVQRGNLVGFGDSKMVGAGLGAQNSVPGGYDVGNGYLFKVARATNRACLNLGRSGSTLLTDPVGSALGYNAEVISDYLAYLPTGWDASQDVIVWELGYNDAQRVIDGSAASVTAWTNAITAKLAALATTGANVFIYAIPPSSTFNLINTSTHTDVYATILNAATQNAVTALNVSNVVFRSTTVTGPHALNGAINPGYATLGAGDTQDGVHFNSHGESQMLAILTADVPTWTAPAATGVIKRRPRTIGAS